MTEAKKLHALLDEIEDMAEDRMDADHNGVTFVPNDWMKLVTMIREVRGERHGER